MAMREGNWGSFVLAGGVCIFYLSFSWNAKRLGGWLGGMHLFGGEAAWNEW